MTDAPNQMDPTASQLPHPDPDGEYPVTVEAGQDVEHEISAEAVPTPPWPAAPEYTEATAPVMPAPAPTFGGFDVPEAGESYYGPQVAPLADGHGLEGATDNVPVSTRRGRVGAFLRHPIPRRSWVIGGVSSVLAAVLFAAGWLVGAHDPLLAPVRISPAPERVGESAAQRVYGVVKNSVVTVQVSNGGTGSGFFYRPDRVVTNDHVVASSPAILADLALGKHPEVTVSLADGRTRMGRVLAVDPRFDLAIIKMPDGLGVRPLAFGDSRDLEIGSDAYVVGSPFGLATSISAGVISGIDRSTAFAADPVQSELIQTDAAVNPGNSGGPLLDATAAVVGIVTLRPDEADGRTTQGLAFALPSDGVVAAIDQLERYGSVSHPQLGVILDPPSADHPSERGPVISQLLSGSPAAKAGLRVGDELLTVDGQPVRSPGDVVDVLVGKRAHDEVVVTGSRHGDSFSVTVELRERPANS